MGMFLPPLILLIIVGFVLYFAISYIKRAKDNKNRRTLTVILLSGFLIIIFFVIMGVISFYSNPA
ncbi:hypothetical protein METH109765_08795 [Mesobacillus thioparans]